MRRPLWLLILLVPVLGCRGPASGPPPPVDPFFGRTRVEPPHTGWLNARLAADPYYNNATPRPGVPYSSASPGTSPQSAPAQGLAATAPGPSAPAAESPVAKESSNAPGPAVVAASAPGDQITVPMAARTLNDPPLSALIAAGSPAAKAARPASAAPQPHTSSTGAAVAASSAAATAGLPSGGQQLAPPALPAGPAAISLANRERIVRTIAPRPHETAEPASSPIPGLGAASAASGPQQPAMPEGVIDISRLPAPGSPVGAARQSAPEATRGAGAEPQGGAGAVVPAVWDGSGTAQGVRAASFTQQSAYGYDPEYRWLRGKLEYSQIDRRWKLRYIPVDGTTDKFGGSVVIADPSVLTGHERGDFVEVRGQLGAASQGGPGYAPEYLVAQIFALP